jgi:hypothetical protein
MPRRVLLLIVVWLHRIQCHRIRRLPARPHGTALHEQTSSIRSLALCAHTTLGPFWHWHDATGRLCALGRSGEFACVRACVRAWVRRPLDTVPEVLVACAHFRSRR